MKIAKFSVFFSRKDIGERCVKRSPGNKNRKNPSYCTTFGKSADETLLVLLLVVVVLPFIFHCNSFNFGRGKPKAEQ